LREEARLEAERRRAGRGGGSSWFSTGPHGLSGRCTAIAIDPTNVDVIYVGTAGGGVWKSTDGGESWSPRTDDVGTLSIGAVAVLPWSPSIVLAGTGDGNFAGFAGMAIDPFGVGMLRSTDAGATWETTSLAYPTSSTHGFNVLATNATTHVILAGANDGLWRSTDDGATWAQTVTTGNVMEAVWKPGDASRLYITKCNDPFVNSIPDAGIHLSTDDGLTFVRVGTGQPPASLIAQTRLATTPAAPSTIYAHITNANTYMTHGIYRSTDDGASWQLRFNGVNMTGQQGWFNLSIAADPNDAQRVLTGGVELYRSTNGGLDFVQIASNFPLGNETTPHWDHHAMVYQPGSNSVVWIGTDGGVWRSTNDGDLWNSKREGIVSYQYYDICVAQGPGFFMMGGTQDNGIPGRSDLAVWSQSTIVLDGAVCNISPTNPNVIYGQGQYSDHRKSVNGGLTWQAINNGLPGSGPFIAPQDQDPLVGNHVYTSAWSQTAGGMYRTTNGGTLWVNVGAHFAGSIAFSEVSGSTIWTTSIYSGTWLTTDDGTSWTMCATFPFTGQETQVRTHPGNDATAFVTQGGYLTGAPKLVRTTDFGATWEDVGGDLPDIPINSFDADPEAPDEWYVGTDLGVWTSTDGGAHWEPFGDALPNVVVTDLEIRSDAATPPGRKLVAGTFGRGVWEIDLPSLATSVSEVSGLEMSQHLMLDAPYPNPTREGAVLRWAARSDWPVRLEIVDVGGRRVATIVDGGRGDGLVRNASWLADGAASGVYYAVLRAGDETRTRRLVVAR
jgi:photosystem II stability/assembly factor-like uncharacterized protein